MIKQQKLHYARAQNKIATSMISYMPDIGLMKHKQIASVSCTKPQTISMMRCCLAFGVGGTTGSQFGPRSPIIKHIG